MIRYQRIFFFTAVIALICHAHAQEDGNKSAYELLSLEIDLLRSYHSFSDVVNTMIDSAASYAAEEEYEVAVVYLEEAKENIDKIQNKKHTDLSSFIEKNDFFNIKLASGIDYNRQEFELGYEQSDSVLKEELNKPFIGFDILLRPGDYMQIENLLRYDKENLQEELRFKNEYPSASFKWGISAGFIYDKNYRYKELGYNQLLAEAFLKSSDYKSDWYWNFKNTFRYKNYAQESEILPDFFRNTFSGYISRNFNNYNLQLDYRYDYNESLKYRNNDFNEHDAGIAFEALFINRVKARLATRYRYNKFNYLLSDSIFTNASRTLSLNPDIRITLTSMFGFDFDYKHDKKSYTEKTESEPDYTFNYINPAFIFNFSDFSSLSLGYIYEEKLHKDEDFPDNQYIKDQDYYSKGISAGVDFSSIESLLISLSLEYSIRRYPNSQSDANFNIYSNRNILNLLFYAQIPLGENILLNAIGSYDNDKDIDSDFNDAVTSFYTLEFSYHFR